MAKKDNRQWWEKTAEELAKECDEAIRNADKKPQPTEQELIEEDAEFGYDYWED